MLKTATYSTKLTPHFSFASLLLRLFLFGAYQASGRFETGFPRKKEVVLMNEVCEMHQEIPYKAAC